MRLVGLKRYSEVVKILIKPHNANKPCRDISQIKTINLLNLSNVITNLNYKICAAKCNVQ